MVHNRDPTKNCENILLECTPKPSLLLRLLPKYKKPSYMVSIFFMLLKIPPFLYLLLLSHIYSPYKVEIRNNKLTYYHLKTRRCKPLLSTVIQCIIIVLNDVTNKSREQRFITKERIATHANLILLFKPALYSSTLVIKLFESSIKVFYAEILTVAL